MRGSFKLYVGFPGRQNGTLITGFGFALALHYKLSVYRPTHHLQIKVKLQVVALALLTLVKLATIYKRFAISEVAADWRELMILQRTIDTLSALMNN